MNKSKEIIYFRESAIQSIASDLFMYGGIIGLMYFNHKVLAGNGWIDLVFIIFMLMSASARANSNYRRFSSKRELLDYLNEDEGRASS